MQTVSVLYDLRLMTRQKVYTCSTQMRFLSPNIFNPQLVDYLGTKPMDIQRADCTCPWPHGWLVLLDSLRGELGSWPFLISKNVSTLD